MVYTSISDLIGSESDSSDINENYDEEKELLLRKKPFKLGKQGKCSFEIVTSRQKHTKNSYTLRIQFVK